MLPHQTADVLISKLQSAQLFTPRVEMAYKRANDVHKSQTRDVTGSYLEEHIYPIVESVFDRYQQHPQVEELIILAFLHDTVEDSETYTIDDCISEFGAATAARVALLTKPESEKKTEMTQDQKLDFNRKYIDKILNGDDLTRIVKLEDRLNNLSSIEDPNVKDKYRRYIVETEEVFFPLARKTAPVYIQLFEEQLNRLKQLLNN